MGHIVRNPPWGVVDLDTTTGHILVREDWKYEWTLEPGASPWTLTERRRFHATADRHIWGFWSNRLRLRTSGTHELCARIPEAPVNFDIRWALRTGHWTVYVNKLLPSTPSPRSYVMFGARTIHLDSKDGDPYRAGNDAGAARDGFHTIPHEFGHTFPTRAGSAIPVQDEYAHASAHLGDTDSLMNIGRQVRSRHVAALLDELNAMLPGCTFAV